MLHQVQVPLKVYLLLLFLESKLIVWKFWTGCLKPSGGLKTRVSENCSQFLKTIIFLKMMFEQRKKFHWKCCATLVFLSVSGNYSNICKTQHGHLQLAKTTLALMNKVLNIIRERPNFQVLFVIRFYSNQISEGSQSVRSTYVQLLWYKKISTDAPNLLGEGKNPNHNGLK